MTINEQIDRFYSKPFHFSYSSIKKLLSNPGEFFEEYVLGNFKQQSTSAFFVSGRAFHTLVLEPDKFPSEFKEVDYKIPGGKTGTILSALADRVLLQDNPSSNLLDHATEGLALMDEQDLYKSMKDPEKRFAKIATDAGILYFKDLVEFRHLSIIDSTTLSGIRKKVAAIKMHEEASRYLGIYNIDRTIEVFNELKMNTPVEGWDNFFFKGYVDNVTIDHDQKTIYINDLKTTGKPLDQFGESIEAFDYWMQCFIYIYMGTKMFSQYTDYRVIFGFIVIDYSDDIQCFMFDESYHDEWTDRINETMDKVYEAYHGLRRFAEQPASV